MQHYKLRLTATLDNFDHQTCDQCTLSLHQGCDREVGAVGKTGRNVKHFCKQGAMPTNNHMNVDSEGELKKQI